MRMLDRNSVSSGCCDECGSQIYREKGKYILDGGFTYRLLCGSCATGILTDTQSRGKVAKLICLECGAPYKLWYPTHVLYPLLCGQCRQKAYTQSMASKSGAHYDRWMTGLQKAAGISTESVIDPT